MQLRRAFNTPELLEFGSFSAEGDEPFEIFDVDLAVPAICRCRASWFLEEIETVGFWLFRVNSRVRLA